MGEICFCRPQTHRHELIILKNKPRWHQIFQQYHSCCFHSLKQQQLSTKVPWKLQERWVWGGQSWARGRKWRELELEEEWWEDDETWQDNEHDCTAEAVHEKTWHVVPISSSPSPEPLERRQFQRISCLATYPSVLGWDTQPLICLMECVCRKKAILYEVNVQPKPCMSVNEKQIVNPDEIKKQQTIFILHFNTTRPKPKDNKGKLLVLPLSQKCAFLVHIHVQMKTKSLSQDRFAFAEAFTSLNQTNSAQS